MTDEACQENQQEDDYYGDFGHKLDIHLPGYINFDMVIMYTTLLKSMSITTDNTSTFYKIEFLLRLRRHQL